MNVDLVVSAEILTRLDAKTDGVTDANIVDVGAPNEEGSLNRAEEGIHKNAGSMVKDEIWKRRQIILSYLGRHHHVERPAHSKAVPQAAEQTAQ